MTEQPKPDRTPERALAELDQLVSQINEELGEPEREAAQPDMTEPAYAGLFPWMTQWWLDHLDAAPVVVIRCGYRDPLTRKRECRNAIGEVKAEGDRIMAMSKNEYPEVTTDRPALAAPTVAKLAAEIAEHEAQVLFHTGTGPGDGTTVYKRTALPREVAPVDDLSFYVCRLHGAVDVNPADLAAFVRESSSDTTAPTRTYRAHRAVD